MRARVLHLGVTGAAAALIGGVLLPGTSWAASADSTRIQADPGDLSVEQMVDDTTPIVGDEVTFQVRARNLGNTDVNANTLTAVLPASFTFVSGTAPTGWNCDFPAVDFTGSIVCTKAVFVQFTDATLEYVAKATGEGEATATATIDSTDPDPNPTNDQSSLTLTVGAAPAAPAPGAGVPVEPGFPEQPPRPPGPSAFGGGYGGGWYDWDDCDWDCY